MCCTISPVLPSSIHCASFQCAFFHPSRVFAAIMTLTLQPQQNQRTRQDSQHVIFAIWHYDLIFQAKLDWVSISIHWWNCQTLTAQVGCILVHAHCPTTHPCVQVPCLLRSSVCVSPFNDEQCAKLDKLDEIISSNPFKCDSFIVKVWLIKGQLEILFRSVII